MFNFNSCIYLDNAATSRHKPRAVIRAVEKELLRSSNPGRGGHKESLRALTKVESARDEVCSLVGNRDVIFTKNCTEALNIAIFSAYKSGEIITTSYEHNSVLRPIEKLKNSGASVHYVSTKGQIITPKDLQKYINKKTSLIVIQEMSNVNGTKQPIEELGAFIKDYGIPFCVDIAQSIGHVKTDYKDVDYLAAPSHKGLHGTQGAGFLAVKKGCPLSPVLYGGTGTESASLKQPLTPPEGLEAGTLNTAGIVGLKEAIKYTKIHFERINKKIKNLSAYLLTELKKIDGVRLYTTEQNGVISFNVGEYSSTEIADILDREYDICVRAGLHCAPLMHRYLGTFRQGTVRASIGVNNTYGDIERLIEAVRSLASKR